MRRSHLALSVASLVLATSAAQAAEPSADVAATFGNTVVSTYPDGRSQKIWLRPDGSWTGRSRRGNPLAGTWTVKGPKVCLRQTKPPTLPISFCQVFPANPETGLDAKDLLGTPIHLKLVKGHVSEASG